MSTLPAKIRKVYFSNKLIIPLFADFFKETAYEESIQTTQQTLQNHFGITSVRYVRNDFGRFLWTVYVQSVGIMSCMC